VIFHTEQQVELRFVPRAAVPPSRKPA
jgi:hypothetical protein